MVILGVTVLLLILIFSGIPIAVGMGLTTVISFIFLGKPEMLTMVAQRMYASTTSFTLLAIPFFIFTGNLMNTGGITKRIFSLAKAIVGHIPGGLGQVNVVASMIFAGMSGSAVADATGLGLIEIKAMTEGGYDRKFSAAITAVSSTIGPVIPPSISFVIYGSLTGVSVGRLFLAGFTPGIAMGIALMIVVYFISIKRHYPKEQRSTFKELFICAKDSFLALTMPIFIIGGILMGLFTPTEASVSSSVYALFIGLVVFKEIKIKDLPSIIWTTINQSVVVLFVISAAGFFGYLLIYEKIPEKIIMYLINFGSSPNMVLLLIIFILLVLGCFIEGIAITMITLPIFMPIIYKFGIDPVHFGVVNTLAHMIGLVTPPVGMCLYAVSSISEIPIDALFKEMIPYIIGLFVVLLLFTYIPFLSLWLPNLLMGK